MSSKIIKTQKSSKLEKLVNIELEYFSGSKKIHSIKITGDFFIHPEETIEKLESQLCGEILDNSLEGKIQQTLQDTQCYGFDAKSLADAIISTKE